MKGHENSVNRARILTSWELPKHVCQAFTRQIRVYQHEKVGENRGKFYLSPTACQRICRLFLCRSHTPTWVYEHEFANFSLSCTGCLRHCECILSLVIWIEQYNTLSHWKLVMIKVQLFKELTTLSTRHYGLFCHKLSTRWWFCWVVSTYYPPSIKTTDQSQNTQEASPHTEMFRMVDWLNYRIQGHLFTSYWITIVPIVFRFEVGLCGKSEITTTRRSK